MNYQSVVPIFEDNKKCLENEISKEILERYEPIYIEKAINGYFPNLTKTERKQILSIALNEVSKEDIKGFIYYKKRLDLIKKELKTYLKDAKSIFIEGFINFRLKDYLKELDGICQRAGEKFLFDKEFDEFCKLLSFFVSVSEKKEPLVHIISDNEGPHLLDSKKTDITEKYFSMSPDIFDEFMMSDFDIVLSALIEASPEKIVLHTLFSDELFVNTIEKVFSGRVYRCLGCNMCNDL